VTDEGPTRMHSVLTVTPPLLFSLFSLLVCPAVSVSSYHVQIYGMGGSTCTQRVLMTAIENGAEFEIKTVDLRKGEHKQPAHLARQPFGQIPAVEDDGFVVYESRAIARYINDTRGNKLVPSDPKKRALMEQWISLEQGTITPEVRSHHDANNSPVCFYSL
jgi:glutathione S-transferase